VRFSFHRGSLALDFIGTVGQRASDAPEERLPDPAALATWLREAGLPEPSHVTDAELAAAHALREAMYVLGTQTLDGRSLERAALDLVNAAARGRMLGALQLVARGKASWRTGEALEFSMGVLAEDAIRRFTEERERLARCELPGCGALLLSRSRSDPRRWCSMDTCGNRAKAAAFRARKRERRQRG
jgi:predicted RNA-binding Zn ribbon-like protein